MLRAQSLVNLIRQFILFFVRQPPHFLLLLTACGFLVPSPERSRFDFNQNDIGVTLRTCQCSGYPEAHKNAFESNRHWQGLSGFAKSEGGPEILSEARRKAPFVLAAGSYLSRRVPQRTARFFVEAEVGEILSSYRKEGPTLSPERRVALNHLLDFRSG